MNKDKNKIIYKFNIQKDIQVLISHIKDNLNLIKANLIEKVKQFLIKIHLY
jgi:hypothetical protein